MKPDAYYRTHIRSRYHAHRPSMWRRRAVVAAQGLILGALAYANIVLWLAKS
jgi:hypothetical protein